MREAVGGGGGVFRKFLQEILNIKYITWALKASPNTMQNITEDLIIFSILEILFRT